MIKAAGVHNEKPLLILGLSGENVTRLMAGEPILLDTAPLGLPEMSVVVVGGRTEQAILDDLRAHGLIAPVATP
jgi:hypothetical protein